MAKTNIDALKSGFQIMAAGFALVAVGLALLGFSFMLTAGVLSGLGIFIIALGAGVLVTGFIKVNLAHNTLVRYGTPKRRR